MATWSWIKRNKIEVKHTVGHSIHNSTVWCSQKIIWRSDRKYLQSTDEVTACSPISRTTFIQNYYHALEHILLLYWHWHGHVRVSNKSEVKEKDKPIYVLDKKTLDILPPLVWCGGAMLWHVSTIRSHCVSPPAVASQQNILTGYWAVASSAHIFRRVTAVIEQ